MFFDSNYLLWVFIPTLILSIGAQLYVRSTYSKWSKIRNGSSLTGAQVAQRIITATRLGDVAFVQAGAPAGMRGARVEGIGLERVSGQLTDHYDPRDHTVRMSDAVATEPSIASMAIVAHELGHAQQHEENSIFIQMRNILIPAVTFSPQIAFAMIFAGLIFRITGLLWLGIGFFAIMVLFTVLTLPVEIDASRRGLILLREAGLMNTEDDISGSRSVLTAAALTYVAAAVTAVLQLLYYISLAQRRR
jgi:Zn-dependent membrane protease YugP